MLAGNTNYELGTRVRLRNITDPNDLDLNGRVGVLCRPFRQFPIQDVGVRLDEADCNPQRCRQIDHNFVMHQCGEKSVTVYKNEFIAI